MSYANSKGADQTACPCSLICIFVVCCLYEETFSGVLSIISKQVRLLPGCPFSLVTHIFFVDFEMLWLIFIVYIYIYTGALLQNIDWVLGPMKSQKNEVLS